MKTINYYTAAMLPAHLQAIARELTHNEQGIPVDEIHDVTSLFADAADICDRVEEKGLGTSKMKEVRQLTQFLQSKNATLFILDN